MRMTISEDSIFVEKQTGLKAIQIKTSPYPGFATDLQTTGSTPLLLTAAGRGRIVDTIYENGSTMYQNWLKWGHHFDLERPHYL